MRVLDLRDHTDPIRLDRMAPGRLLSVMCYPNDIPSRERFLGAIQRATGQSRVRRRCLTLEQMHVAYHFHLGRGMQAGHILLAQLQMFANGEQPTKENAVRLHRWLLPQWTKDGVMNWRVGNQHEHLSRKREELLSTFAAYGPVAHLWAGWIHGEQASYSEAMADQGPEVWPNMPIPRLVGYAARFSELYSRLPLQMRQLRRGFNPVTRFRVTIPESLREYPQVLAQPFPEEYRL